MSSCVMIMESDGFVKWTFPVYMMVWYAYAFRPCKGRSHKMIAFCVPLIFEVEIVHNYCILKACYINKCAPFIRTTYIIPI